MPDLTIRRSPNHGRRPPGVRVDCLVLHADASRTEEGTIGWLCDPVSKVSYHFLVHRDGNITQLVPGEMRAWHAGASSFQGRANVNDFSLGVAFANRQDGEPFQVAQLQRGVELCADLCWEYRIPLTRITTHAAIAPGRKTDPGPLFPLAHFITDVGAELARRRTEGLE